MKVLLAAVVVCLALSFSGCTKKGADQSAGTESAQNPPDEMQKKDDAPAAADATTEEKKD